MRENSKYSLCLTYGPRELETMKQIDALVKNDVLPDNRNEIFRRGLHSTRYLAEVNELLLMEILSWHLHSTAKDGNSKDFDTAKSLSFAVLAVLIAKYGLLKAEAFETIPMTLNSISCAKTNKEATDSSVFAAAIRHNIGEIATSLDTIYLKNPNLHGFHNS